MPSKILNKWSRKLHRWGAIMIAVPLLLVILSGLLLQIKKQSSWVQPPTMKGSVQDEQPNILWSEILATAADKKYAAANIRTWNDIDRLDVRPSKGVIKVRAKSGYELQIDLANGEVLAFDYRRSDFIESLHDGSFFSSNAKLWIFLPNGLILLGLWISGIYLWFLPVLARRKKRLAKAKSKTIIAGQ